MFQNSTQTVAKLIFHPGPTWFCPQLIFNVKLFGTSFQMVGGCANFLNDTLHPVYQNLFTEKYDAIVLHGIDICGFGLTELMKNPSRIWMSPTFLIDFMAHYSGTEICLYPLLQ